MDTPSHGAVRRLGDFRWQVSDARDGYTITARFSRGGTLTLQGATATNPWHRLRLALQDATIERDLAIIEGYLQLHAAEHGGTPPAPEELTPAGAVGRRHPAWPADPYAGEPFTIGPGLGHFTSTVAAGGDYVLSAPLAGSDTPCVIEGDVTPDDRAGGAASLASGALLPPGR
jgi:hypothetical protein